MPETSEEYVEPKPDLVNHISTGKSGEAMGTEWLQQRGFIIKEQNWRHNRWEVGVIAEKKLFYIL